MEADVESRLLQFVERQLDQGNPLADNNAASGLASQKMSPPPPTHILYFLSLSGKMATYSIFSLLFWDFCFAFQEHILSSITTLEKKKQARIDGFLQNITDTNPRSPKYHRYRYRYSSKILEIRSPKYCRYRYKSTELSGEKWFHPKVTQLTLSEKIALVILLRNCSIFTFATFVFAKRS